MTLQFPQKPDECRQLEALLPPFVDGEATAADGSRIEAHLARCAECRESVRAQREVRALLVSRRASLSEPAPAGLEGRVRQLAHPAPAAAGWRSRVSPLAAAAALVLALTGGLYWGTGQSSVLLAAQLTLDHLKCFMLDGDEELHGMTADSAQVRLHEAYGLDVKLPAPRDDRDARLVAVRDCLYGEGWVAHVLYRVQGEPVSMFVMPQQHAASADLSAFGRHTQVVTRGDTTYVLVSPAQLAGVAAAVGLEGE